MIDFFYWCSFAVFQTTFALFAARRFGFGVAKTGYVFAAFGVLGALIQGGLIRTVVRRLGDKRTFIMGLVFGAVGLVAAAAAQSVPMFLLALVPLALGIGFGHPTMSSLVSLVARGEEQGRVQGAASAVESLGRTVGPVWGNSSLQHFGESTPYLSAAVLLLLTLAIAAGFEVPTHETAPVTRPADAPMHRLAASVVIPSFFQLRAGPHPRAASNSRHRLRRFGEEHFRARRAR